MIQPTSPAFQQDTYITGLPLSASTVRLKTTGTAFEKHTDIIAMKKQRIMRPSNQ